MVLVLRQFALNVGRSLMDSESVYIKHEMKEIFATKEYAAHHWFQQGWMACRLAYLLHDQAEEVGAFRV